MLMLNFTNFSYHLAPFFTLLYYFLAKLQLPVSSREINSAHFLLYPLFLPTGGSTLKIRLVLDCQLEGW